MRIERGTQHRFTEQEADYFMRSWYRVVEGDGSTVAYAPDLATAEQIKAAMEGGNP